MIASTWPADTANGNALTLVFPWITFTETPAKLVSSGKLRAWVKVAGPSCCPTIEKIDP